MNTAFLLLHRWASIPTLLTAQQRLIPFASSKFIYFAHSAVRNDLQSPIEHTILLAAIDSSLQKAFLKKKVCLLFDSIIPLLRFNLRK